ncbi:MFS transporter [Actinoallomurus rhizosphaericola]|uniref:MFS transporter n=1 Tax=Actinoallomurus rhizosphaericola TaxID=2952536 RepID=UPI0020915F4F|nr:MFS transporter [Actinoallomurus rhizosphaericola]MCO5994631.1 MFS transporter [Actinoallomurus rhizosphaericola]
MRTPPVVNSPDTAAVPRGRSMAALFCGAALMNAAMAMTSAVATIVAGDALGAAWGAVPNSAGVVGTGVGALVLTWLAGRRGRRAGLVLGYAAAALGAGLTVVAVAVGDVPALIAGMLMLGLGNAGAQLSRYAAADLYPAHRRGFALGLLVWAGTVGAVGGPLLLDPAGAAAHRLGAAAMTGPFLAAAVAGTVAAVAALGAPAGRVRVAASPLPLRDLVRTPAARSALSVMVTAQVVMVAVMTAAPMDMHMRGHGLGAVGVILSTHTLGMFALSPLTGRLVDRAGARPVMLAGLLSLAVAALLAAAAPEGEMALRAGALFLLGYGWNLCFVSGSGLLARDLPAAERARVEGAVDAAVWGIAAVASLASTLLLSVGGYPALAALSCVLLAVPLVLVLFGGDVARRSSS